MLSLISVMVRDSLYAILAVNIPGDELDGVNVIVSVPSCVDPVAPYQLLAR